MLMPKLSSKNETSPIQRYEFGSFLLDSIERRLLLNGQIIPLTSRLFDILWVLVRNHGKVVTKEELMELVWQDQFVEDSNLTVSMSAIRKALGESYGDRKYIETVSKSGYRFTAQVKEVRDISGSENQFKNQLNEPNKSNNIIQNLAVLPFANETENPELDYISDGLSESITNNLSQIPQFQVLARSIVNSYRGENRDLKRIRQESNVGIFLTGRIFQLKDDLSISVELINSENGFLIAGMTYALAPSDLLNVQKTITTEVSKKLSLTRTLYGKNRLTKNYTRNSEAYNFYIKGRYFLTKKSVKAIEKAIEYFNQAIAYDENYSLAYSGLADCYTTLALFGAYSPRELTPQATMAVERALAIDETLAEAHGSLAKIKVNFDWDWSGAIKEYQRTFELNPDYVPAYQWYADHLARTGLFERALETINMALEMEPFSLPHRKARIKILYIARQYDEALRYCLEALEIEPDYSPIKGLMGYIYTQQQKYEEAISTIQEFVNFTAGDYEISVSQDLKSNQASQRNSIFSKSDPESIAALGYAYARAGKTDQAVELVRRLNELSKYRYVEPHTLAMIYIGLGERDMAFVWLEKAFEDRSHILTFLKVWVLFDPLRNDPRFMDLYNRVNFAREY